MVDRPTVHVSRPYKRVNEKEVRQQDFAVALAHYRDSLLPARVQGVEARPVPSAFSPNSSDARKA